MKKTIIVAMVLTVVGCTSTTKTETKEEANIPQKIEQDSKSLGQNSELAEIKKLVENEKEKVKDNQYRIRLLNSILAHLNNAEVATSELLRRMAIEKMLNEIATYPTGSVEWETKIQEMQKIK